MRRSADHAMMMAFRAKESEGRYARTKSVRDLTDVIRNDAKTKETVKYLVAQKPERKGIPIGQRWG